MTEDQRDAILQAQAEAEIKIRGQLDAQKEKQLTALRKRIDARKQKQLSELRQKQDREKIEVGFRQGWIDV